MDAMDGDEVNDNDESTESKTEIGVDLIIDHHFAEQGTRYRVG